MINYDVWIVCDRCKSKSKHRVGKRKTDIPSISMIKVLLTDEGWLVKGILADEIKMYCPECRKDIEDAIRKK